ncbi:hypothetical protein B0H10DRAFT_1939987 [Mycena sp. CBHHK59/15]|nr:hypothetical protein B0H10DRAFT_1939987 [Mycena sp. CBHHK59/15]
MLTLLRMMQSGAPDIIPLRKVVGGCLLDKAASTVEEKLLKILDSQALGAVTDSWKSLTKDSIWMRPEMWTKRSYTIELTDTTSMDKSGPSMCQQFCNTQMVKVKRARASRKAVHILDPPVLLGTPGEQVRCPDAEMSTAIIGWINNHGKVRKVFDHAQRGISKDRLGYFLILAYLVVNLTCWTTHCIAFIWAAKGAEAIAFAAEADRFCDMIMDATFWLSLELLVEDIEPICYGTNINQKDSTRADQVLLSLAGMFLCMVEHPEPEVAKGMTHISKSVGRIAISRSSCSH